MNLCGAADFPDTVGEVNLVIAPFEFRGIEEQSGVEADFGIDRGG